MLLKRLRDFTEEEINAHPNGDNIRRLRELTKYPNGKVEKPKKCKYLGKKRPDIPHRKCCMPHECSHEKTPEIITNKLCKKCKFNSLI